MHKPACKLTQSSSSPSALIDYIDARSFVLRNRRRTTTTLGLVRLNLNGTHNANRYAAVLRSWLEANQGHAPTQRLGYDTGASVRLLPHQRQLASLGA